MGSAVALGVGGALTMSKATIDAALDALGADLLAEGGPRISTMRNYNFAIVPYHPREELLLRQGVARLTGTLRAAGWNVLAVNLQRLLLDRMRALGEEDLASLVRLEKTLHARSWARGLQQVRQQVGNIVDGPDGLAADVSSLISRFAEQSPDAARRAMAFVGRAGAVYPFFRTSALLKHIDGRTRNIPVVLLYPGVQIGRGLSFMGRLDPDPDYRPRIYA